MGVAWFIAPYPYEKWDSALDDFYLNAEDFFEAFQNHFDMRIVKQWNDEGDISWDLCTLDEQLVGFYGLLHRDRKCVSSHSPLKDLFIEFVLWYRNFVPEAYALYLWNDYDPKHGLVLTPHTSASEISRFMGYSD